MKDILTHQDLAMVYAPEYLAEGETFEQDEEFLYEETLYENDQIDAITTYLAESYDSEDLDTIFEMVEDLQSYMVEFFEFDNENEVNEAILMLDSESLVDIFEDIYEGTGIVEDTYHDITESVQFVYDSADVIEESILAEAGMPGKKAPLSKILSKRGRTVIGLRGRREEDRENRRELADRQQNIEADRESTKPNPDYAKAVWGGFIKGKELNDRMRKNRPSYNRNRLPSYSESYEFTQDDYDYLMEEAAVLSTLKVAELLSEVNLKTIARNIGGVAGRAYGRHVKAMKDLDAYNKERRQVLDQWKAQREQQTTNKNQPSSEKQPYVSRGKKKNRPKPTIGNKKAERGVYKPKLSVANGKRNPAVRKSEPAVEQSTKKSTTPFDASSGAKLTSVTSVPKPQRKRARLKMKKPSVNTVKMGTGKTTDTSGSSSLRWSPETGKNLIPYNKKGNRSFGGAADSIGKAFKADPNKVARRKYD